ANVGTNTSDAGGLRRAAIRHGGLTARRGPRRPCRQCAYDATRLSDNVRQIECWFSLAVEQLMAKLCVETLDVPRAALLDVSGLGTDNRDPFYARSVGQPEPAALGLLIGDLWPLTLPDTLDYPARLAQELGDRHDRAEPCVASSEAARAPHRPEIPGHRKRGKEAIQA